MKDSLFELLLNLFEKTLLQLKEKQLFESEQKKGIDVVLSDENMTTTVIKGESRVVVIRSANESAARVFTVDERLKLTKASQQFLIRMAAWDIIPREVLELIVNRLMFSDSRFVNLQETKWTLRNLLAESLTAGQLAFLDLVIYQQEDNVVIH